MGREKRNAKLAAMEDVEHACMARGPAVDCASKQDPILWLACKAMDQRVTKPVALGTKQIYRVTSTKEANRMIHASSSSTSATLPRMVWQGRGLDRNDGGSMAVAQHARTHL
jgi:hypothetical protein